MNPVRILRIIRSLLIFFLIFQANPPSYVAGSREPAQTPEKPAVVHINYPDQQELTFLAQILDIWEVDHKNHTLLALVTPPEWERLAAEGYRLVVDADKTRLLDSPQPLIPGQTSGIPGYPCYRTVEETYQSMMKLAQDVPNLAEIIPIGVSWDKLRAGGPAGYDLYALRLTNESHPGPKPIFFLMAEIHAREYATAELALRFGEWLIQNYGVDADATWLLDFNEIHIVPMTNPDGRKFAEAGAWWRKNTDQDYCRSSNYGIDLNRNHSFAWGGASSDACTEVYQGPNPASEPETQAIQAYVASLFPDQRGGNLTDAAPADATGLFLTLHSYGQLVLFPWGWSNGPAPNNQALETLGRKFGFFNGYEVCQSGENGCLYSTTGTSDDWAYGELGVAAYTFEVGTRFFESCSYFDNTLLPNNLHALLYAFKAARRPYMSPAGPETLIVTASPAQIEAGDPITLTATADDTRYFSNGWGNEPAQPVADARFSIDAPSWITGTVLQPLFPADGVFNSPVEVLQAAAPVPCLSPGTHTLLVESKDHDGNWGVPGAAFFQVKPIADLGWTSSVGYAQPSQTITFTLPITNVDSISHTFDIHSTSSWPISIPSFTGPIAPSGTVDLSMIITVPWDAVPGDGNTARITITYDTGTCPLKAITLMTFVPKTILRLPVIYR